MAFIKFFFKSKTRVYYNAFYLKEVDSESQSVRTVWDAHKIQK